VGLSGDINRSIAHSNLFFDSVARHGLLGPAWRTRAQETIIPEEYKAAFCPTDGTALRRATEADFGTYLVDDILVKVDRASMLTSLEVRAPWLDYRIIELAFGRVPDRLRVAGGERKILPRRLATRLLPPTLNLKRKQGFAIPLRSWLRGDWGRFIEGVLNEADPGLFSRDAVSNLIKAQRRGLANEQRLFALTMFELWRREYKVAT
jgi:asparagine synthase (glutamine-hydrolysing)